jgi:hypothetical protein
VLQSSKLVTIGEKMFETSLLDCKEDEEGVSIFLSKCLFDNPIVIIELKLLTIP